MILSDKDLRTRIIQGREEVERAKEWWKRSDWNKIANSIVVSPFEAHTLGPCCYGLRIGKEYVSLRDPETVKPLNEGDHITISPTETVLILTREYLCLPRNVLAMVIPRATWIFEGISLSATRVDPTWYGKLLVGVTNLSKNPVTLDYDEEFCTCYFMETSQTEKILTPDIQKSLGREKIGSVKITHAKQQKLMLPDRVTRDEIDKVVDLYGWPWDVVRGIVHLTRKEIGEWVEKEVASAIVDDATSAAVKIAFDKLEAHYQEQTRWTRNLVITVISVLTTVGAAVLAAAITYLIKQWA